MTDIKDVFKHHKSRVDKIDTIEEKTKKDTYGVLIRVSDVKQVTKDSIPMQRERAYKFIKERDGILYKEYIEEAVSASKNSIKQRPVLQELLKDIEDGKINKVIAYKRDRLSRIQKDWLTILDTIFKNNCDIEFTSAEEQPISSNPMVRGIMEPVLGFLANMESNNTSMRVKETRASIAAKGRWTGGTLPYGYDLNKNKEIVVIKEVIPSLIEIEDLYLNGIGVGSITRYMNGHEVKHLGKRKKGADIKRVVYKGRKTYWTESAVEGVLFNPFYAGIIEYSKEGNKHLQYDQDKFVREKGFHEAIRTLDKQEKIYEMKSKKSISAPRKFSTTFLLTGLVYCSECGSPIQSRTVLKKERNNEKYCYYVCASKQNKDKTSRNEICPSKNFKQNILEDFVVSKLLELFDGFNKDNLKEEILKGIDQGKSTIETDIVSAQAELKELQSELVSIMNLMKRVNPESPLYEEIITDYEKSYTETLLKKKEIEEKLESLQQSIKENNDKEIEQNIVLDALKNFSIVFKEASQVQRKTLLDSIIKRIDISQDGKLNILCNFEIPKDEESYVHSINRRPV